MKPESSDYKYKKRSDIPAVYRWNIEAIYETEEDFQQDIANCTDVLAEITGMHGIVTESARHLLNALRAADKLDLILGRLFCYAKMKLDEDNTHAPSQERYATATALLAEAQEKSSFLTPELITLDTDVLEKYYEAEPELDIYRFSLGRLLESKAHVLTPAEEALIAGYAEVLSAPDNIFSMLNDADLIFGKIKLPNGKRVILTHGNYVQFLENPSRKLRRKAFKQLYGVYAAHINTLAATYQTQVKSDCITARLRKYPSARAAALFASHIPEEVYDNLIAAVHAHLPSLHGYIDLKRRLLGVKEMHMYDIYAPLTTVPEKNFSFDEALDLIKAALRPLGEEYLAGIDRAVRERWIDLCETPGKSSGAYSFGTYDTYPYILTNYHGKLQDVLTLIHEMGHSMHSFYTRNAQPPVYGDYSIFVAEVASTVNECLLLHYLLRTEDAPDMKVYLLNRFLEEIRATVFRQTMFAEFEDQVHKKVEAGEALSAEGLSALYDSLNSLYCGGFVRGDSLIQYEWARIPHFYHAFYVYQYATGFSAALAISERILSGVPGAVEGYLRFLTLGSSQYPIDELMIAGVDMTTPAPVEAAMRYFENLVKEFTSLTQEKDEAVQ